MVTKHAVTLQVLDFLDLCRPIVCGAVVSQPDVTLHVLDNLGNSH